MALTAGRNIALFALIAAPILSRHLESVGTRLPDWGQDTEPISEKLTRIINPVLLLFLCAAALIKVRVPLNEEDNLEILANRMPIQAVQILKTESPPGPLFSSYNWGGYIIWELYPHYLSFVDGRTDLFDDDILQDYLNLYRVDEGWESSFKNWGFQSALLEPNAPILRELQRMGWRELYRDDQAVVLTSSDG
jgi:hypothetical protein